MYMYLRAYLQILEIYSSWYYYFVAETVQLCLNLCIKNSKNILIIMHNNNHNNMSKENAANEHIV